MIAFLFVIPVAGILVMIAWRIHRANRLIGSILRDESGGVR